MDPHDTDAVVVRKELLTDSLFTIAFKPEKKIDFLPGQYLSVILPGLRPRPFSIASSPSSDEIELGVVVVGEGTRALRDAKVGEKAVLRGPFGRFVLRNEEKACFLAGGTGVAPFMSMLRQIRDAKRTVDAKLLYSCRTRETVLWKDELRAVGEDAVITLTEERASGFHHGRIDDAMIRQEVPDFAQRTFYVCGPPGFVTAMSDALRSLGVPDDRMRRERW